MSDFIDRRVNNDLVAVRMGGRVAVIGAGIGGLAAAVRLAARGCDVTVLESRAAPGGKMREVRVDGAAIDCGPTVLTMDWVFEDLFAAGGARLRERVGLAPAGVLARHAWPGGARLDLFADRARSSDAIGRFAGAAEARGFVEFAERAARIWATLRPSFVCAERPSVAGLVARAGVRDLVGISPFTTLARALRQHFRDPRLHQLFGRYATYCGSSPFEAPATLMLVAHVESEGVWLVEGGMQRLADALAALALELGVRVRCNAAVREIVVRGARARGVVLASGEVVEADAVVCNADTHALASGRFGALGGVVSPTRPGQRSFSALTWALRARTGGFPLLRHTVFFSGDERAEFDSLRRGLPEAPTVYVCAQDRHAQDGGAQGRGAQDGGARGRGTRDWGTQDGSAGENDARLDALADAPERLLCLVNAPATGDANPPTEKEIARCEQATFDHLRRCGLELEPASTPSLALGTTTGPAQFEALFPATGGALYGPSSHGWAASFRRPGARSKVAGLYLAGGSTHPGPGVPMAALSGALAASAVMEDLASTARSARTATSGGTSTR